MNLFKNIRSKIDTKNESNNNIISLKEYKKMKNSKPYVIYDYYYDKKKKHLLTNKDIADFERLLDVYKYVRNYILNQNISTKDKSNLIISMSHYLLELRHNQDVNIYIHTLMDYKNELINKCNYNLN